MTHRALTLRIPADWLVWYAAAGAGAVVLDLLMQWWRFRRVVHVGTNIPLTWLAWPLWLAIVLWLPLREHLVDRLYARERARGARL